MRFVVIGAGAIGGVVGGFLARAGREVVLVARGAQAAAIDERGLRVETPGGAFTVQVPVVEQPARVAWRADDVAMLAVKTQDAAVALGDLAAAATVPVVCLTNGIETERLALRQLAEVYAACVMLPATYLSPGVVQAWAAPSPGAIDVGRYPDDVHGRDARAVAIAAALSEAGFVCRTPDDIMRWKRGKLLSNLANSAEAMCGPAARLSPLADRARREAVACFAAAGLSHTSDEEYAARNVATRAQPIAGATRGGGSTWQSLARGQSLETDYLNGEIVLLGRLHGVATPVNAMLQRVVGDAARDGLAPGAMTIDELTARIDRAPVDRA